MSANATWVDRRGLAHKGKELHEPVSPTGRKFGEPGIAEAVRRSSNASETKDAATALPGASGGRRRSSGTGGMFGNLNTMKRGSGDYGERRASQQEMYGSGGGIVSGWFNQTFKGHQKPAADSGQK